MKSWPAYYTRVHIIQEILRYMKIVSNSAPVEANMTSLVEVVIIKVDTVITADKWLKPHWSLQPLVCDSFVIYQSLNQSLIWQLAATQYNDRHLIILSSHSTEQLQKHKPQMSRHYIKVI